MNFWDGFAVLLAMTSIALLLVGLSLIITPFLRSQALSKPGLVYTIIGIVLECISVVLWNVSKRVGRRYHKRS